MRKEILIGENQETSTRSNSKVKTILSTEKKRESVEWKSIFSWWGI